MLPHEYYCLLPHELHSVCKGYYHKQQSISSEKRFATYISLLPFVKDLNYERFCREVWQLDIDKPKQGEGEPLQVDMELWQQIKKQMRPKKTEYEKITEKHKQHKRIK